MSKTILLVEDDSAIVESTQCVLEFAGFQVKTAPDGYAMKKHINGTVPDLILIDYWLPKKNGGEIIKELREDSKTKHVPVLVISASHNIKEIIQEAGADGFLEKPFNMDDLISTVGKYL